MALDEYGLTPKQRAFADEYIRTGNARDAARNAGYKYPQQSAIDNTAKRSVKAYIAQRMQPKVDRRIADADEVLAFLSATMRGEIKDQFGLDPSLQDRIKAGQELMKRYAVADMRQQSTMQRLDALFVEFKAAVSSTPTAPLQGAQAALPVDMVDTTDTTTDGTEGTADG